ncbi:uncharacterized protein EI97DRAFT_137550 [Westerdykella ornata]|uniref:Uncharacterized protein n=1 Tax=Westerdykella ornata TaxID=318751 RepID=A0A6A6JB88_WESOR|nr:uncharacterized protein EI97DRAFT_137550 [Westerdykella ornata]KAF2273880.1 hypothetical protein EI97DRAFT_137550 [Westerdykella ornata]
MAVDNSLSALLTTLTESITSAIQALPAADTILPPKDGISLLDVKNELLLSYLQNLVFLILLKLRSRSGKSHPTSAETNGTIDETVANGDRKSESLDREVIKKLAELRLYIEKGIWPLENRLKYQIDKILRTAETSERKPTVQAERPRLPKTKKIMNPVESDITSDDGSAAENGFGRADDAEDLDTTSFGPNRAAFVRSKPSAADESRASASTKDGIYRPPRITPMAMPTTTAREERQARHAAKSATLDEFVATELSAAPMAEPSIGSTIVQGGRRMKSDKERREEAERREYEEANFVRLPTQGKKDKAKSRGGRDGGWGGEEWRGLGAGLDRIERLTQKKGGSSKGAMGMLERSRKRGRDVGDGDRGSGAQIGAAFEKRRRYRR